MKTTLFVLTAAAVVLSADYYPVRFEDGYAYTAGMTALYAAPELPADITLSIPPGELIEITAFTGITIIYDSYEWGWYEATWIQDSAAISGYVFEPDLALSYLPAGDDTLFVYSTVGFRGGDTVVGRVAVIVSGEVLSSLFVEPAWLQGMLDFNVYICPLDPSGLTGVRNLFSLYSGKWNTEGSEREYLIAWTDDGRLVEGPQTAEAAYGGPTSYWTDVILPSDASGKDDQVIFNVLGEVYNQDKGKWENIIDELEVYRWTGEEFVKIWPEDTYGGEAADADRMDRG